MFQILNIFDEILHILIQQKIRYYHHLKIYKNTFSLLFITFYHEFQYYEELFFILINIMDICQNM